MNKKVFILLYNYDEDEANPILGVYSSLEKAKEAAMWDCNAKTIKEPITFLGYSKFRVVEIAIDQYKTICYHSFRTRLFGGIYHHRCQMCGYEKQEDRSVIDHGWNNEPIIHFFEIERIEK